MNALEVKLSNGMVAVIDDADAHLTCGIRWHAQVNRSGVVYAIAYGFGRKKVYMHRRIPMKSTKLPNSAPIWLDRTAGKT